VLHWTRPVSVSVLMQALDLSAQASQAYRSGNIRQAIQLQNRCVELKIQLFGKRSVQAALSFNELGGFYLRSNNLEAAQKALKKALKVRDYRSVGGSEIGPRWHRDLGTCIGVALLLRFVFVHLLTSSSAMDKGKVWLNTVAELLQLHANYVCSVQI